MIHFQNQPVFFCSFDITQMNNQLGIIGMSGRNEQDRKWLSLSSWKNAALKIQYILQYVWKISPLQIRLCSGGSSWFDP